MKERWFEYVVNNKKYWPYGFTVKRLQKVRTAVLADKDIVWDLLERHSGAIYPPEDMRQMDYAMFDHCIGNFTSLIRQKMIELKILKN